ncbi:dystrotelin [Tenrec ecaudatus]|uniref:dystrotelin n=1 Tax=Tenrec ecaudatus TaxID=94439 RepID=UPI003F5AA965
MDPDKQDALNSIENSIYRTAFKLRSVQTLCQLDLIDSYLIQHLLLHQHFQEARTGSLSVRQLFQALQGLFQRVRVETPGQMLPRASELTLSLLTAMYDSMGTGVLKLVPAAAALIALSGDSPLTKYRALFQLYADNARGSGEAGARMTRRMLRNLLTDLQQIPMVVGESRALCSVESATRSCFQGVLSPAIKEEKFLSWLQSEPPILLWLPTFYRLSVSEMVTHPVRCSICRNFPITGLRYRCLKCFNFDICQVCFLFGLHSKSHQKSHPVIEHCVQPLSAKENTKLLFRTLRNNLLQGRCRKKETERRQWLLDQGNSKCTRNQGHARVLRKQLNRCKDKLQVIYASQEEKSCRLEIKIHQLKTNQENLWNKLQQMGQELQAVLQPLHPLSSSCQSLTSKNDHSLAKRSWRKGESFQTKNIAEEGSERESVPNPARSHPRQTNTEHALPNPETPKATLKQRSVQNSTAQSQSPKVLKETLLGAQEGLLEDTSQFVSAEISSSARAPAERKESTNIEERKDELEEEELQELLSKCMDAFTLEMPSGPRASVNTNLYGGAEEVSRAFSGLMDHITLPNLK